MTAHNTLKYLDALIIHSSIDMAPADVKRHNKEVVWRWLFKPTVL